MRAVTVFAQPSTAPEASTLAVDLQWAQKKGVSVTYIDTTTEAARIEAFPEAAVVFAAQGNAALPLFLVDGAVVLQGRYPSRKELAGWTGVVMGSAFCLDDACGASGACC